MKYKYIHLAFVTAYGLYHGLYGMESTADTPSVYGDVGSPGYDYDVCPDMSMNEIMRQLLKYASLGEIRKTEWTGNYYTIGAGLIKHYNRYVDDMETIRDFPYIPEVLHIAIHYGPQKLPTKKYVEAMLAVGADINAKNTEQSNETALHWAVRSKDSSLCAYLISKGAELEAKTDSIGGTPLIYAAGSGNAECCKELLEHKANANAKDNKGRRALHYAAAEGYTNCCSVLLEHGAKVNSKDKTGETPLITAASNGHVECCKLLLEHGAKVDSKDKNGETALFHAVGNNDVDCCKVLLKHGADVYAPNNDGKVPLTKVKSGKIRKLMEKYAKS